MYQLVATDLDGTLLRSDKTISKETIDKIIEIDQKGVIFLPSTGRTHLELPNSIKQLPFLHYAITVNGGGIYDYFRQEYIYETTIPNHIALKVIEFCKNLPVRPTVVCQGKRFMPADETGEIEPYIQKVAAKGVLNYAVGVSDIYQTVKDNGNNIQKLLLYANGPEYKEEVITTLSKAFPELSITSSGALYIEVNSYGVDKGKALTYLCDMLNIPIENTIAFGDAENDIALLDAAGLSVVMINGTDNTKKHADLITESDCDNDGFRKVLELYF